MDHIVLKTINISKRFGKTTALDSVSCDLRKGEVLAIVGENGAGKSTLVSIISGIHRQNTGKILLNNKELHIDDTPAKRQRIGINLVAQEINPFQNLSIDENIYVNRQLTNRLGLISYRRLYNESKKLLKSFNIYDDPRTPVRNLPLHKKQLIEILSKIIMKSNVLILDEPTSSLTEDEVNNLFNSIRKLKKQGVSIIYVSHKLKEVFEIADRIMVLRDGKHVKTLLKKETETNKIIKMMVGRELTDDFYGNINIIKSSHSKNQLLSIKNFNSKDYENINFDLFNGEIIGLAGLAGDGRKELAKAIIGISRRKSGDIYLKGKKVTIKNLKNAIHRGFGYMPDDRKESGLFLNMTVKENMVCVNNKDFNGLGLISRKFENYISKKYIDILGIKTSGVMAKANQLSGGNQQKLLLAKWLKTNPKILIVDEPTRGVDVGAKVEIYKILKNITKSGTGVVIVSIDQAELIGLCDRIYIFYQGKIVKHIKNNELINEEQILKIASLGK